MARLPNWPNSVPRPQKTQRVRRGSKGAYLGTLELRLTWPLKDREEPHKAQRILVSTVRTATNARAAALTYRGCLFLLWPWPMECAFLCWLHSI